MKRSWRGVILLSIVLFLNIYFTQKAVHQFFFENYTATVIFAALNVMLFPIALIIYKREKEVE
jgi:hypothetical protein